MTVRAERLTVDECVRDRINGLGMGKSTAMRMSLAKDQYQ